MRIIYLFLSLLPFIGSNAHAIDLSMQTIKKECANCITDVEFMNSAIAGLRNGYYTIYVSNFSTGIVKKIYYRNLVSYDRNGDPIYSKEKYFEPVESIFLTSMTKYNNAQARLTLLLGQNHIPSFISESAYDVVVDPSKLNMIESYLSQIDGLIDWVGSLVEAVLVLRGINPTIDVIFNDGSRLILRIKDVSINSLRMTFTIERAIDRFGNTIPLNLKGYYSMGIAKFPSTAAGIIDIGKLMNNATMHGLPVVTIPQGATITISIGSAGSGSGSGSGMSANITLSPAGSSIKACGAPASASNSPSLYCSGI